MFCQGLKLIVGIRQRTSSYSSFQQTLSQKIGISTIRGGGMGIVPDSKTKVPWSYIPREFCTVFAKTHSLITERERSGNPTGSASFAFVRNSSSDFESGVFESLNPCSSASSTIRSHRFGVRTTRLIEGNFFEM